jgi:hypothetical protein
MYVLRHVLKDPFVENEGHLLAQKNKPILIVHGRCYLRLKMDPPLPFTGPKRKLLVFTIEPE